MPNALVDRATSDMLIGPDWAMNLEICGILNHDPGQARDFVKGLKKRIRSKNPRIQLLALSLLEVVVRNCGDMVHTHIADKDVPRAMAKIAKKKPDFHVKEKILSLISSWQEAFGGLQEKYPQFFIAYQDLLRAGMTFPKRAEMPATIFQSRRPTSYPYPTRNYDKIATKTEGQVDSDITILSFSDIQNARGVMEVLVEMLNSLEPRNKEGVKQQVIVELVEQCRLYRQRVVHLVNSTSDEELLLHCLSLNDDLQNVLAKYDSLATGVSNKEPKKQKSLQALVDIDVLYNKNQDDNNESDQRSNASGSTSNQALLQQLLLPATSGSHIDLLSGDNFGTVSEENSLVLVPADETAGASLEKTQNMLVISSAYSPRNSVKNNYLANKASSELVCASDSQFQQQDQILPHTNGSFSNHGGSVYEQGPSVQSNHAYPSWNNQFSHSGNMQHQVQTGELDQGGSLPPPPWETEPAESIQHDHAYDCHNAYSHSAHSSQVASYNYGQRSDSQFYGHNTAYSYSNTTEISHRMYGLSMQDNAYKNAPQIPTSSSYLQPPIKHSKQEDNLFGDLVSMAKSNKPAN
ncbi:hypothetical protein KSP39_PZI005643 [Platanthera zijinensis]|uniref:Target of Myb protein 1 n=1 Tax=Platanthera zijinensis TaxID=2320716 RepID=A0AAP0BSM0_9ASPA